MASVTQKDLQNILAWALRATRTQIIRYIAKFLGEPDSACEGLYWMWHGTHPMGLVAHIDTIPEMRKAFPPVLTMKENVLSSKHKRGLGADDRAGIAAIIAVILRGYRPTVIICDKEEIGGVGASTLVDDWAEAPYNLSALLEMDRRGHNDVVYYGLDIHADDSMELREILENKAGFSWEIGSFSDISFIAPAWNVAAANISAGYYNEHTTNETINVKEWAFNVDRVCKILDFTTSLRRLSYSERTVFSKGSEYYFDWKLPSDYDDDDSLTGMGGKVIQLPDRYDGTSEGLGGYDERGKYHAVYPDTGRVWKRGY